MYFYKIEVYYPFGKTNYVIMSHDYYLDNHQLNIIVQQAFDECIEKHIIKEKLLKTFLMSMVLLQKQHQMDYILKTLDFG